MKDPSYNSNQYLKGIDANDINLIEHIKNADLIVNTTPVGMSNNRSADNNSNNMPLGQELWQHLKPSTIAYDLIYTPRPTPWLINAAKYGCECIDGLEMLIQQGASSLKLWSGFNEIPIEIMRQAAKNHLLN